MAPVKLVPVMVTLVPPAAGPDVGLMPVTVGAASVGPPVSSSRLALEVAPSVKSRFPLPSERTEVGPLRVASVLEGPPAIV